MIIIIFCPWTSVAVLTMDSSSFNLDSNLRLFFRLSLSLLDLFGLSLVAVFLASSSSLSSSSSCNMFAFTAGQRAVAAFADFSGITLSLCTCLLHSFGCSCDGFRDHGLAAIFLQLAYLLSSLASRVRPANEPLVPESAPPCSVSVHLLPDHHELRLHIRPRSWRRAPPVRLSGLCVRNPLRNFGNCLVVTCELCNACFVLRRTPL